MDYRMYDGGAPAGENVVPYIIKSLRDGGQLAQGPLKFVGFEGSAGIEFYLNKHNEKIVIPTCGYFITPYSADYYMPVYSLKFVNAFPGNIYYII